VTARRLIVWRHGRTAHNNSKRIQGSTDIPLDATGLAQAEQSAAILAAHRPAAIVASDLMRARATAEALSRLTGIAVTTDPRLRERAFGQWEGLGFEEILQRWPLEATAWRHGRDVPEVGMETRSAAAGRFVTGVITAAEQVANGGTLVVASHGGVIVCGLTALLGLDPVEWLGLRVMGNARWAVVESADHASSGWRLASYDVGPPDTAADGAPWFGPERGTA
jgi:probable phosphoglycerate mutase